MFRWIVGFIFLGLPAFAATDQCATRDDQIFAALYPDAVSVSEGVYKVGDRTVILPRAADSSFDLLMVCRQWPAHPDRLLVAVPLMEATDEDSQQGDLELAVLDADTLKVQARLRQQNFLIGDAVRVTGVTFDTAYYDLFGDGPAFGIRLHYYGSSRPNPLEMQTLWLFDQRDGALREVLSGTVVAFSGGEWDTNCAGQFYDTSRAVEISDQRHNGAADLILRPTETHSVSEMNGGECESSEVPPEDPLEVIVLEYDGTRYVVPEEVRGW